MQVITAKKLYKFLPAFAKGLIIFIIHSFRSVSYLGKGRWCPVCERTSRKFRTAGSDPRKDAECTHCNALERHRFVWLYFGRQTNLFNNTPKKMLHIAPEIFFESRLRKRLGTGYVTADLIDKGVDVKMDITDIQYPDGYFDVIYCSHVLEHVQDDRKAMRELLRVLKPEGWAILLVPINAEKTFEDPSIVEPSERLRVFGQEDHVRLYGADYVDRLRESGFKVKVTSVPELFYKDEIEIMGLTPASGNIYYCTK
jgi:SAM-dependent methyltransferase